MLEQRKALHFVVDAHIIRKARLILQILAIFCAGLQSLQWIGVLNVPIS